MSTLEKIANFSIIAASAAALYVLIDQRFNPQRPPDLTGKQLNVQGLLTGPTPSLSVVIALSPDCAYCVRSLPFYRKISETRQASGAGLQFAVLSPQSVENTTKFLTDSAVKVDKVLQAPLSALGISITPTVLIVDEKGSVRRVFRGKLRESAEQEVLRIVEAKHL